MEYIHVDEVERRVIEIIKELDFDTLAQLAEHLLGGVYTWYGGDMFYHEPEEQYEHIKS